MSNPSETDPRASHATTDGDDPTSDGAESSPRVAVVGIGNEIMSDDGVGPHAIDELRETWLGSADEVVLSNAGTTGFFALEAMSGCDRAIVIDAIEAGESPGTIREYRLVDGTFEDEIPEMTMHDVSFTEALQFGGEAYDLPGEVRILGVEPATIEPGLELSETVEAVLPDLVEAVAEDIGSEGPKGRSTDRHRQEGTT